MVSRSAVIVCSSCLRGVGELLARGGVSDLRQIWSGYSWNRAGDDKSVTPGGISLNVDALASWGRDDEGRLVEERVGHDTLCPEEERREMHALLASAYSSMQMPGDALRHAGAALASAGSLQSLQDAADIVFDATLLPATSLEALRTFLFRA